VVASRLPVVVRPLARSCGTRRARQPFMDKAKKLEQERDDEQREGLTEKRRGSPPAASDRPEGTTPHPQDVNEISERS
jgi:hypothetical protein